MEEPDEEEERVSAGETPEVKFARARAKLLGDAGHQGHAALRAGDNAGKKSKNQKREHALSESGARPGAEVGAGAGKDERVPGGAGEGAGGGGAPVFDVVRLGCGAEILDGGSTLAQTIEHRVSGAELGYGEEICYTDDDPPELIYFQHPTTTVWGGESRSPLARWDILMRELRGGNFLIGLAEMPITSKHNGQDTFATRCRERTRNPKLNPEP